MVNWWGYRWGQKKILNQIPVIVEIVDVNPPLSAKNNRLIRMHEKPAELAGFFRSRLSCMQGEFFGIAGRTAVIDVSSVTSWFVNRAVRNQRARYSWV